MTTTNNDNYGQSDVTLLPPSVDPLRQILPARNLSPVEAELVSEIQTRIGPAWRAHSQSRAVLHRTVVQTFEALRTDNRFIYIKGFLSDCQSRLAAEVGISKGYYSQLKKAVAFYQELEATEAPHCLELYQSMTTGAQYVFATLPKETRDKLFHKYLCKKEVPSQTTLEEIRSSLSAWKKKKPEEKFTYVNPIELFTDGTTDGKFTHVNSEDEEAFEWTEDFRPIPKQSLPPVNISTPEPQHEEQPPLPTASVDVVATPSEPPAEPTPAQTPLSISESYLSFKRVFEQDYKGIHTDEDRRLWEHLTGDLERLLRQVKGDLRGGDCF